MLETFLFICACCESNRKGQNRFKQSSETISRKFHEVLDCVIAMAKDYLRPTDPNFWIVHKMIQNDRKAYPHFKDCNGAIDGTHVQVSLSPQEQVKYIGETDIPTQNVLVICYFDMRVTYVSTGQSSSYHDTNVLYNAMEVDEKDSCQPLHGINYVNFLSRSSVMSISCILMFYLRCVGKYYFVHAGYPNRPGYLAPYKGKRYHLPEWHRGVELISPKEKFNQFT
jgi:hypothetical protein